MVHFVNIAASLALCLTECSNHAIVRRHLVLRHSSLRRFQAFEVLKGLHERMHGCCLCQCAIRSPFLVLLLAFGPESFAHRVCCEVPHTDLVDSVQIHAPLHEKILSPCLHARVLFLPLPVQRFGAILQVCQEGAEALVTDNLQIAKEAIVHVLTVLQINTT